MYKRITPLELLDKAVYIPDGVHTGVCEQKPRTFMSSSFPPRH